MRGIRNYYKLRFTKLCMEPLHTQDCFGISRKNLKGWVFIINPYNTCVAKIPTTIHSVLLFGMWMTSKCPKLNKTCGQVIEEYGQRIWRVISR